MIALVIPGASLMSIHVTDDDAIVIDCPGCGAQLRLSAAVVQQGGHVALQHADGCPVHARIQRAIGRYERDVVRLG